MFAKLQIEIYFSDFLTCTRMVFTSKSPLSQKDSTDMFGKLSASASLIPPDPKYPLERAVVEVYSRNELGNHLSPKVKPGQNIMPIRMQVLTKNSHIMTEEPSDKWFRLIIPLEVDNLIQSSKTKGSDQNCEIEITLHPDLSQSELYTHLSSATYHCTQVCQKEDKKAVRQPKLSVSMDSGTKVFRHFHFFFKSNFSEAESKSSKMYVSQLENTKLPGIRAVSVFFRSVCLSAVAELPSRLEQLEGGLAKADLETLSQYKKGLNKIKKFLDENKELTPLGLDILDKVEELLQLVDERLGPDQMDSQGRISNKAILEIEPLLNSDFFAQLFVEVDPDWKELYIMVGCHMSMGQGHTYNTPLRVCSEVLERAVTRINEQRKHKGMYNVGVIKPNFGLFTDRFMSRGKLTATQTPRQIKEWLVSQQATGASFYEPALKMLCQGWHKSDLDARQKIRTEKCSSKLEKLGVWMRYLFENKQTLQELKKKGPKHQRAIMIITDGDIVDETKLHKLVQTYAVDNETLSGRNPLRLVGGWRCPDRFNKLCQDLKKLTQNEKSETKSETLTKQAKCLDPDELLDEVLTTLKLNENQLTIHLGDPMNVKMHKMFGREIKVQLALQAENLWMATMLIEAPADKLIKPVHQQSIKVIMSKELGGADLFEFNEETKSSLTSALEESDIQKKFKDSLEYYCWMVIEGQQQHLHNMSPAEKFGQQLIERAHLNLVARVLERDLIRRNSQHDSVLERKPIFRLIADVTGSRLSFFDGSVERRLVPNDFEFARQESLLCEVISNSDCWTNKTIDDLREEPLVCFKRLMVTLWVEFSTDATTNTFQFQQQLFFDMLNLLWSRTDSLVLSATKELREVHKLETVSAKIGFRQSLDATVCALKRVVERSEEVRKTLRHQLLLMAHSLLDDCTRLRPNQSSEQEFEPDVVEEFPPQLFEVRSYEYKSWSTTRHICVTVAKSRTQEVWTAKPPDSDAPTLQPAAPVTTESTELWFRREDSTYSDGSGICREGLLEKHNPYFRRFYYRLRNTLSDLVRDGFETTWERFLKFVRDQTMKKEGFEIDDMTCLDMPEGLSQLSPDKRGQPISMSKLATFKSVYDTFFSPGKGPEELKTQTEGQDKKQVHLSAAQEEFLESAGICQELEKIMLSDKYESTLDLNVTSAELNLEKERFSRCFTEITFALSRIQRVQISEIHSLDNYFGYNFQKRECLPDNLKGRFITMGLLLEEQIGAREAYRIYFTWLHFTQNLTKKTPPPDDEFIHDLLGKHVELFGINCSDPLIKEIRTGMAAVWEADQPSYEAQVVLKAKQIFYTSTIDTDRIVEEVDEGAPREIASSSDKPKNFCRKFIFEDDGFVINPLANNAAPGLQPQQNPVKKKKHFTLSFPDELIPRFESYNDEEVGTTRKSYPGSMQIGEITDAKGHFQKFRGEPFNREKFDAIQDAWAVFIQPYNTEIKKVLTHLSQYKTDFDEDHDLWWDFCFGRFEPSITRADDSQLRTFLRFIELKVQRVLTAPGMTVPHRQEGQTLQSYIKTARKQYVRARATLPFDEVSRKAAFETLQELKKIEAVALFPYFYVFKKFMRFVNDELEEQRRERERQEEENRRRR